jgi:hypothetical protein
MEDQVRLKRLIIVYFVMATFLVNIIGKYLEKNLDNFLLSLAERIRVFYVIDFNTFNLT